MLEIRRCIPRAVLPLLHAAEALRALAGIDFRGVDAALRVDGDVVHPVEIAGVAAVAAEGADALAAFAHEDVHRCCRRPPAVSAVRDLLWGRGPTPSPTRASWA